VIDVKLGREDHSLIPATATGRRLESLDDRTDPKSDSTASENEEK
jgi:hypothetical protein